MIYRSGVLQKLTTGDQALVGSLEIRTVVDFRSLEEQEKNPGTLPGQRRISMPCNIEVMTRDRLKPLLFKRGAGHRIVEVIDSVYLDMVDLMVGPMGELVRLILEPGSLPMIIHCRAGKDRTGFAAAMIQGYLGVDYQDILHEYLKSNEFLGPKIKRALRRLRLFTVGLFPKGNLQAAFEVREQYLLTAMKRVKEEYGGMEGYLMRGGVTAEELEKLRERLVISFAELAFGSVDE